ncbi:nuclease-related domain-containing protein [Sporosarcina sp. GW1-11]|uniref:nuclease-related domain-containing protein n=1 Tax=Sporosarcina sp. GW1-11 TaxID=2899126 RepID=UPI00294F40DB|nr:nuclease-related domain-containing protein [Sporosarcina sp. GW1-11]MDV6378235.1 nuclease-related domain-containing protein [Sporosarcina sp. GW1-11]
MIYKTRVMPRLIIGQNALLKRLPVNHEKYEKIQSDFYNGKAGFGGEKEFDYQLREFIPPYPHAILHDLFLKQDHAYFQIDSILITPSIIILFEIKNIAGKLHIKQNPTQFIRESANGQRTVLKSPLAELERKKYFFANWLQQRNIDIPLIEFVVFAYQNELTIENMASSNIAFSYEIPNKLRALEIQNDILTSEQIHRLANELKSAHREYEPVPLTAKYNLTMKELTSGVACPNCNLLSMRWESKKWRCKACDHQDLVAHLTALQEWYCIEGTQLTNQQFRQFSNIHSRHIAKRLLANPYTQLSGKKRYAIYHLSPKLLSNPTNLSF